jgi:hypothetical protein
MPAVAVSPCAIGAFGKAEFCADPDRLQTTWLPHCFALRQRPPRSSRSVSRCHPTDASCLPHEGGSTPARFRTAASVPQAAPRSSRRCRRQRCGAGDHFGKSRLVGDPYASYVPEMDAGFHPTEHPAAGMPAATAVVATKIRRDIRRPRMLAASRSCRTDQGHARGLSRRITTAGRELPLVEIVRLPLPLGGRLCSSDV